MASVPFFANADPGFVSEVVTKLKYEVFLPGWCPLGSSTNTCLSFPPLHSLASPGRGEGGAVRRGRSGALGKLEHKASEPRSLGGLLCEILRPCWYLMLNRLMNHSTVLRKAGTVISNITLNYDLKEKTITKEGQVQSSILRGMSHLAWDYHAPAFHSSSTMRSFPLKKIFTVTFGNLLVKKLFHWSPSERCAAQTVRHGSSQPHASARWPGASSLVPAAVPGHGQEAGGEQSTSSARGRRREGAPSTQRWFYSEYRYSAISSVWSGLITCLHPSLV